jgi:hypothetical protein
VPGRPGFDIETDARARAWLESHPASEPRVITYDVHRCCGGGRICEVQVRERGLRDVSGYASGVIDGEAPVAIDPRAAARLPARFRLTVRGIGPLKRLELELDGPQWGALLYD